MYIIFYPLQDHYQCFEATLSTALLHGRNGSAVLEPGPRGLVWIDNFPVIRNVPLPRREYSLGPYYGPLPSLKGSGLWALILKVVYDGVIMGF